ncbi:hypothetical protein GCM10010260_54210 [Streptomyces filipinensis]|uniref:Uncharacterized protein n=1 Tax=Streptomyces filipinensis TaxID=66887 RepID=A0A918IEX6_9ACTN|nr:hypothetical protein [Streptomyces filipinensis]GGV09136.1 hypothetical protein GCM10010260_54210 [Streptomyces filipinensis]
MSGTTAPWDPQLQRWRVGHGPIAPAKPRRSGPVRTTPSLWRRPSGPGAAGAEGAVPWDRVRQSWAHDDTEAWEASASDASGRRAGALLRRTAVPLCALAFSAVLAVSGHRWAGCVTLVWTALMVRGVRAVRRTAAEERAVAVKGAASPAVPSPDPDPVSPGRAFAEGVAQVLALPALFAPGSARPAHEPHRRARPPEPSRERSRRYVAEELMRAHAELGLPLPGERGVLGRGRNTGGAP